MRKITWTIIFLLVLLGDLIGIAMGNELLKMICKPLLMPVLMALFIMETRTFRSPLKPWIILALIFSWVGDIVLMFEGKQANAFLFGLGAFLLAQIFYIVFFHLLRIRENIQSNIWLLFVVVLYYAILISFLSPHMDAPQFRAMKLPVRIYGVVISFMLMLAMHTLFGTNKKAGWLMTIGAVLFVASDSMLAINKFYASFDYSGLAIMLTYGLAQLFIVLGAVSYFRNAELNRITEPTSA